jgi:hypothetical protein
MLRAYVLTYKDPYIPSVIGCNSKTLTCFTSNDKCKRKWKKLFPIYAHRRQQNSRGKIEIFITEFKFIIYLLDNGTKCEHIFKNKNTFPIELQQPTLETKVLLQAR